MNLDLVKHHFILVTGKKMVEDLSTYFPNDKFIVHSLNLDRFKIDDAKNLSSLATNTSYSEKTSVFVVKFRDITVDASNALLKVLEEPRQNVRFVFFTEDETRIIDTIKSRAYHVRGVSRGGDIGGDLTDQVYKDFMLSDLNQKLSNKYVLDADGEYSRTKVCEFIDGLVIYLSKNYPEKSSDFVLKYIKIRPSLLSSISPKMVFEFVCYFLAISNLV